MENMEFKKYHQIDADSFYIGDVFTSKKTPDLVDTPMPEGLFKAKWDGDAWVDTQPEKREELNQRLYAEYRKAAYPPISDFVDAIVKGDETQKQEYLQKCMDVKNKYPKDGVYSPREP